MTVKGSKEYQYKVIRYRPQIRVIVTVAIIVAFVLASYFAYQYGRQEVSGKLQTLEKTILAQSVELERVKKSETAALQKLENTLVGAEVDKGALEEVRQEIAELKATINELEEENQFYRNLMAPSENRKGLTFGAVEIIDTDRPRSYRFKIVMQQLATKHQLLTGTLNFNVVGRRYGETVVLPASELSTDVETANIKLRFKYFQNIEGELILPEDFEPERIELEARATKPKSVTVEKRFGWLVREN